MNLLYLLLFLSVPLYREPIKSITPRIETDLVWVYFTDKGFTATDEYNRALKVFSPNLSPDAVERRVRHNQTPVDFNDLPVYQRYLDEIQALGGNLRTVSNWLNAASFRINQALIPKINSLPYVYDIKPVVISKTEVSQTIFKLNKSKSVKKSNLGPDKIEPAKNEDTTEYRRHYGPSLEQNAMLGVPQLFFQGYTGSKVKVGFLDTGLKKNNRALSHLDTTVVLEHDFLAGDDFFQSTGPDFLTSDVINNLKDIPRIKEPILCYSEPATDTNFIFYTADNFYGFDTFPRRALYAAYTTDAGNTWSQPITITPATLGLGCRTPSAVAGSGRTYVVWQSSPAPNEEVGNIYFGFFKNIVWQGEVFLNQGKLPDIYLKNDSLYLVFVESDTLINFQRGIIFNDSIHWEGRILVDNVSENIISPQLLLDSLNEIEIFATGLKSGKIYHYRSVDNIYSFELQPNPVNNGASATQAYITGNTIHLIYKNFSQSPFVKISYLNSNNGGQTWNTPISVTDELLTIGAFSFMIDDKLYVSYESYGSIYLAQATDGLNWTNSPIDTSEFLYSPMLAKTTNNRSLVWFRRGDDNTDYEPDEDNAVQADHGTHMVSIIAGYKTGEIVGVAPSADILIAKTEFHRTKSGNQRQGYAYEYTVEEDAWIEGLEWAERHGAQIISSSLGYRSWYGETGLDGKTAPISIAAGLGTERGLIIVTAMGNRGQDSLSYPWPSPYIVAPGDASGVITAGGVHKYRTPWRGSGTGPTIDGRMKPELVAMSDTVVVVMPDSADGIEGSAGTSDATALIAGCCALILEAHPDWNADSVKQALFSTAVIPPGYDTINESDPMYVFGYGIPNVDSALKLYPPETPSYESDQLLSPYPNPFILDSDDDKIFFPFSLTRPTKVAELKIFTLSGELVYDTALADVPRPGRYGINGNRAELIQIGAFWSGKNNNGKQVGSGLYFVVFKTGYATDIKKFAVVR